MNIISAKDLTPYKKIGKNPSDCLNMSQSTCELFNKVNAFRASNNVPKLIAIENCILSAQQHSENMYSQEKLKHNIKGSKWVDRIKTHGALGELMAENVALSSTPTQVIKQWKGSKHHLNNMTNNKFTHTGVGQKGRYWTQCFLRKFEK